MRTIVRFVRFALAIGALLIADGLCAQSRANDVIMKEGAVTFLVDKDLPAPRDTFYTISDGEQIIQSLLRDKELPYSSVVKSSFASDKLCYFGYDTFFKGMVKAFADHRPVTLTPDAIWLLICQGLAHHVNDNPEQMRPLLVSHEGKMDLVVRSDLPLTNPDVSWEALLSDFTDEIGTYTKDGVAELITASFSTTGVNERMASQITLMESVKSYFEYIVIYMSCGIPDITLTGTPADWKSILERTRKLEKYGLKWWTDQLIPILEEFVRASEGHPDTGFWMNIVKTKRPEEVRGGGCSPDTPTEFDGWFLKFLPFDEDGRTPEHVNILHKFAPEMVKVPFRYIELNDATGLVERDEPMEMWAGLVGMEQDARYGLTPKIGWLVRRSEDEAKVLNELVTKNKSGYGLDLKVAEVPEVLKKVGAIRRLTLNFTDDVVIPQWMDSIEIESLTIEGKVDERQALSLFERFPDNLRIRSTILNNGYMNNKEDLKRYRQRQSGNSLFKTTPLPTGEKAGDTIRGVVSDSIGPIMMANVVERDAGNRIVAHAVTDSIGEFSFRLQNPKDRIEVSYIGFETVSLTIDTTFFDVTLKLKDVPVLEINEINRKTECR